MSEAPGAVDLLALDRTALSVALAPVVDRPFRIAQIYEALHHRGETDFAGMTDLPKSLRATLSERFRGALPEVDSRDTSTDGTTKLLLRLEDGASIEAVDIPERTRRTLCISSQAGCALACAFCVTGYWGAGRDLRAGEIVGQVLLARRLLDLPASLNLVFMGMGEPLLNLDHVRTALDRLSETISPRRTTVSTSGVVPGIDAMAKWPRRPNLAVSLHAPDDERRSAIMPINRAHPIAELLAALRRFPLEPRRRITIEYILIRDFNDAAGDADSLARLLRGLRVKVNLIPVNPDPVLGDEMRPPDEEVVLKFRKRIEDRGFTATIRKRRGDDVAAACGQLRAFARAPRGFRAGQHSDVRSSSGS